MSQTETKTTATETATVAQRTITIVTTRGQKTKIAFEGNKWADLKKLLERGGATGLKDDDDRDFFDSYDLSNMKCVESLNRTTLEHPEAIVPAGNFNLFLMPYKSKSGAGVMSRAEINAAIKDHIATDGDKAKSYFTIDGKNYTMVGSAKLLELLESYKPGTKKAAAQNKTTATANIADVVASVKDSKEGELYEELAGLTTEEKLDLVIKLLLDMKNGTGTSTAPVSAPVEEIAPMVEEPKETPEQKKAREKLEREAEEKRLAAEKKKKEEKEEDDRLEKEMNDLMSGFNDVKR